MKLLGFCENCNHDIYEEDQMDCCGDLVLVSYDELEELQDESPEQLAGEMFEDKLAMYRNEY